MSLRLANRLSPVLAASILSLAMSSSAFALEGKALLDDLIAKSNGTVSYGSAEESGSTLTVMDLKLDAAKEENQDLTIGTVVFENLRDDGTDLLADSVTLESLVGGATDSVERSTVRRVEGEGVKLPMALFDGTAENDPYGKRIVLGSWDAVELVSENKDGSTFRIAAIDTDGLDVPLDFRYSDEAVKAAGDREPAEPASLGKLLLNGIEVVSGAGIKTTVGDFQLDGMKVPTAMGAPVTQWLSEDFALKVGQISVVRGDADILGGMESLTSTVSAPTANEWVQDSEMKGLFIDAGAITDANAQATLKTLGYDQITVDSSGRATYDLQTGRATQDPLLIDAKDMFDLTLSYAITGYTPDVATQISDLFNPAKNAGGQPDFAKLMTLLSEVKLENLSLKLEDDSLTKKLLDFQGRQMGTTGDQLAQGAPMMVGVGLGQLGMPEFAQSVATAVGDFLRDRGSITVETGTSEPIPLAAIFAASQQSPKNVIETLNLKVSAAK